VQVSVWEIKAFSKPDQAVSHVGSAFGAAIANGSIAGIVGPVLPHNQADGCLKLTDGSEPYVGY